MDSGLKIRHLASGDPALGEVAALLGDLYRCLARLGSPVRLKPDGAMLWQRSIEKTLGRVHWVAIGLTHDSVVGFVHAHLRIPAGYYEGRSVGVIDHLYICPEYRQMGIGTRLVDEARRWFVSHATETVELQVVQGNREAMAFWRRAGFEIELTQMRMNLRVSCQ